MAVIQISKIQVRRGSIGDQGMPQLASGEMGWAVDTQQLFIGNGSVAEGAPAVGNTEILTVSSTASTNNLFTQFLGNDIYKYQGNKKDATAFQPYAVARTVQDKLDERVSILDFGADPNGIKESTQAIQSAITATYLNSHDSGANTSFKKILFFPAGTYLVTSTIYLPPYITISGEGADNTVIVAANTSGRTTIFRTRSVITGTNGTLDFKRPLSDISDTVPGVAINDMTFRYGDNVQIYTTTTSTSPLINLDMTTYSQVSNCKFQGTYTNLFGALPSAVNVFGQIPIRYAGIYVTGQNTKNLTIQGNEFTGLVLGTVCYQDNQYVSYVNNIYDTLYYGLYSGTTSTSVGNINGTLYSQAINNQFININRAGINVSVPQGTTATTGFTSNGNLFSNVGNGATGNEGGQISECIIFNQATGCVSINDRFTRFDLAQTTYKTSAFRPLVRAKTIVIDNHIAYKYPIDWTSTATLIRIPYLTTMTGVVMEYQVEKSASLGGPITGVRKGTFIVNASPYNVGTVTYSDNYNYAGTEPGIVLTAKLINSTNTNITKVFDCIAIQYENDQYSAINNTGTGLISLTVKYQT
jgi:hypothetical protein